MAEARKIFSSGKGSFLLTLPKNWVAENGLKSGDVVLLDIGRDKITIYPERGEREKKVARIDYEGSTLDSLIRRIISYYLAGYDSMNVKIYNDEQRNAISIASEILIGFEIMEDLGEEIRIEVFLDLNRLKPEDILEKTSRICQSMFSDFCRAFTEFDKYICSTIIARENETDKLHFLILRLLKLASDYPDVKKSLRLEGKTMEFQTVVRALERVADHAAKIAESLLMLQKPVPELCELVDFSGDMLKTAVISFFKADAELAEEVLQSCDDFFKNEEDFYGYILSKELKEALLLKTIIDSLFRILGYSSDIAEAAINLGVKEQ
ncbi:hypothetical protein DRP07_06075 [Archaeoglobales archaeon]|nr:MAG: hypothetical protein DRP07_06075 [Archaeoglobales archaeon]